MRRMEGGGLSYSDHEGVVGEYVVEGVGGEGVEGVGEEKDQMGEWGRSEVEFVLFLGESLCCGDMVVTSR